MNNMEGLNFEKLNRDADESDAEKLEWAAESNELNDPFENLQAKKAYAEAFEEFPEFFFQPVNPDNVPLPKLKERLQDEIKELQADIDGLQDRADKTDYDDCLYQIKRKQQWIGYIDDALNPSVKPSLTIEEEKILDEFNEKTKNQNEKLN